MSHTHAYNNATIIADNTAQCHHSLDNVTSWVLALFCPSTLADLIQPEMIKGFGGDLTWHFTKVAGAKGIFDVNTEPFDPKHALVCQLVCITILLCCQVH